MGRVEELEAELELVRLEGDLAEAKKSKKGADRYLKDEVRAARQAYREARGGAA